MECVCKECGIKYKPKASNRTTCCSRKCGLQWSMRIGQEARASQQRAAATVERLRTIYAQLKTCKVCGLGFRAKGNQVSCGACRKENRNNSCKLCDRPRFKVGSHLSRYCGECRADARKAARKQQRWNRDRKQVGATAKYQSKELLLLLRGLVRRANGKCRLCGLAMSKHCDPNSDRAMEFDHKIPLSQGGPDTVKNLQAICRRCNGLKGTTTSPEIVIGEWILEALPT